MLIGTGIGLGFTRKKPITAPANLIGNQALWEQGTLNYGTIGAAPTKSSSSTRVRTIDPISVISSRAYTLSIQAPYQISFCELDAGGLETESSGWLTAPFTLNTNATTVSIAFRFSRIDSAALTPSDVSSALPSLILT